MLSFVSNFILVQHQISWQFRQSRCQMCSLYKEFNWNVNVCFIQKCVEMCIFVQEEHNHFNILFDMVANHELFCFLLSAHCWGLVFALLSPKCHPSIKLISVCKMTSCFLDFLLKKIWTSVGVAFFLSVFGVDYNCFVYSIKNKKLFFGFTWSLSLTLITRSLPHMQISPFHSQDWRDSRWWWEVMMWKAVLEEGLRAIGGCSGVGGALTAVTQ